MENEMQIPNTTLRAIAIPKPKPLGTPIYVFINQFPCHVFAKDCQDIALQRRKPLVKRSEVNHAWILQSMKYNKAWVDLYDKDKIKLDFDSVPIEAYKEVMLHVCLSGMWTDEAEQYWADMDEKYPGNDLHKSTQEQIEGEGTTYGPDYPGRESLIEIRDEYLKYASWKDAWFLVDWFYQILSAPEQLEDDGLELAYQRFRQFPQLYRHTRILEKARYEGVDFGSARPEVAAGKDSGDRELSTADEEEEDEEDEDEDEEMEEEEEEEESDEEEEEEGGEEEHTMVQLTHEVDDMDIDCE